VSIYICVYVLGVGNGKRIIVNCELGMGLGCWDLGKVRLGNGYWGIFYIDIIIL
jgi:hypothetical protein